jgi:hypothetical protein
MTLSSNSTNKFGPSSLVVGPVGTLGDGCNYTSIQTAIDDCQAAGLGIVMVRHGTYTENLTLRAGVEIIGVSADGRDGSAGPTITGTHTFDEDGFFLFRNVFFQSLAGDVFTVNPAAGASLLGMRNCGIDSAGRCCFLNPAAGAFGLFSIENSQTTSVLQIAETVGGVGNALVRMRDCIATTFSSAFEHAAPGNVEAEGCTINSVTNVFNLNSASSNLVAQFCLLGSSTAAIVDFNAASAAQLYHCTCNSSDVSGNFVTGTGSLSYGNILNGGTASGIDPLVSQFPLDWKPYAESGASPGAGVIRGTSAYDSAHFSVSSGFVQLSGGPTGIIWTDQGANTTVASFSGSFATAAITLTLPAAPAQGDVCLFKCSTASALVIAANVGQTLLVGNQTGTTATSTDLGDALELTYRSVSSTWQANNMIGNFTVA